MSNDKVKPRHLKVGDAILASRIGNDLHHATTKRDSIVARVTAPPELTDSPVGGRRGYAVDTHLGRIAFITGVASVMIPNAADIKRDQRERQGRDRAQSDSAGVLSGLSLSDHQRAERPASVPAHGLTRPVQRADRTTTHVNGVAAPAAAAIAKASSAIPPGRGANAAANYRAMARGSVTDAAREFWEQKAREALT